MTEGKEFKAYNWSQTEYLEGILTEKYVKPVLKQINEIKESAEYKEALENFKKNYTDERIEELKQKIEEAEKYAGLQDKIENAVQKLLKGTKFEKNNIVRVLVGDEDGYEDDIVYLIPRKESCNYELDNYYIYNFKYEPLSEAEAKKYLIKAAINSVLSTTSEETPAKEAIIKAEELLKYLELID